MQDQSKSKTNGTWSWHDVRDC